MKKTLVIGYGNTLRSDDGVGVWIADAIASLGIPGVEVKTCHQLGVELVEEMRGFDDIIFVDASAEGETISYHRSAAESTPSSAGGHHLTPGALQSLARDLYGDEKEIHVFTVRGESFEFGSELSPWVQQRAVAVSNAISDFVRRSARSAPLVDCILN